MAQVWVVLPGGRVERFRDRQVRRDYRERRHGRPAVGRGVRCRVNAARGVRRWLRAELRRAAGRPGALAELAGGIVRAPHGW